MFEHYLSLELKGNLAGQKREMVEKLRMDLMEK